ncbi:zinc finger CCHC domain-containing protein 9-like [Xenia sp. Carnegie-2017]|uniref:zinc finger CCHC domain-containing protein 9-like n=1 Tax=Xenia sp. Carnegie-2017 TaxID=2897299 RepID=UPI001F03B05B|nr:zinc finger CCHC domain-containing protein 9-like [Xenia sp. Carnegie-2017]
MTRFARSGKKKFLEASTWEELSSDKHTWKKVKHNDTNKGCCKLDKTTRNVDGKGTKTQRRTFPDAKRLKQIESRRLRRQKGKCCFICRKYGHKAVACPNENDMNIGTCFKCGSSSHTTQNCKENVDKNISGPFPFAKCFICHEMGHLARSCSENPRGLYPNGGGCKVCGSVEHLKRDCPMITRKYKDNTTVTFNLTTDEESKHTKSADHEESLENVVQSNERREKKEKVVKF